MSKYKRSGLLALTAVGCLVLAGCVSILTAPSSKIADSENAKSSFAYNPLVYHLDLAILAYQLYGQSLVWPFDPYYEERSNGDNDRKKMMAKVKTWTGKQGASQVSNKPRLNSFRGPGQLNGFANNNSHDPIIYNYNLIDPWNQAITNADGKWIEYMTPRAITANIKDVRVCYRPIGASLDTAATAKIKRKHSNISANANGYLLAFEGATGDKGEAGQPASQSLMGFIMTREKPSGGYDIHISFRGSRSGSGGRAAFEALNTSNASGNPDWITDLGYNRLTASEGGAYVSNVGEVHRGFTKSMHAIMPTLMHCLAQVPGLKGGVKPDNIYVTGHSLGGALAQHFVSTILLGNQYGPDATGAKLPASLRSWPWKNIKLITYSAPRVGNATFAKYLTEDKLQSEFFSSPFSATDHNAIKVTNQQIIPRLMDKSRPVAFRVLNSKDPITTEKGAGGKHVGKTVYVNPTESWHTGGLPDVSAHEQNTLRDFMLGTLNDNKIPKVAIRYVPMKGYNPEFDEKQKGSIAEMQKLATATKAYYRIRKIWFDHTLFDKNFKLRQEIRSSP